MNWNKLGKFAQWAIIILLGGFVVIILWWLYNSFIKKDDPKITDDAIVTGATKTGYTQAQIDAFRNSAISIINGLNTSKNQAWYERPYYEDDEGVKEEILKWNKNELIVISEFYKARSNNSMSLKQDLYRLLDDWEAVKHLF